MFRKYKLEEPKMAAKNILREKKLFFKHETLRNKFVLFSMTIKENIMGSKNKTAKAEFSRLTQTITSTNGKNNCTDMSKITSNYKKIYIKNIRIKYLDNIIINIKKIVISRRIKQGTV